MTARVSDRDVLRPVAGDRQAERQQARESHALYPEWPSVGSRCQRHWLQGGALQASQSPQARAHEQSDANRGHDEVQRLSGTDRESVRRVVSEQIDEDPRERIPEHEPRRDRAWRGIGPADVQQVGDQQQVLHAVVEHDWMAESVGIRELDAPPHVRDAPDDLPVDEVANAAHAHQKGPGNNQRVGEGEERPLPDDGKERRRRDRTDEEPVRRHAPKPKGGYQAGVRSIERPLVECDLDGPAAHQRADRYQDGQRPDIPLRQSEPRAVAHQESIDVQESEGEAEAVPPEVHAGNVGEHGIDVMDVASGHGAGVIIPHQASFMTRPIAVDMRSHSRASTASCRRPDAVSW